MSRIAPQPHSGTFLQSCCRGINHPPGAGLPEGSSPPPPPPGSPPLCLPRCPTLCCPHPPPHSPPPNLAPDCPTQPPPELPPQPTPHLNLLRLCPCPLPPPPVLPCVLIALDLGPLLPIPPSGHSHSTCAFMAPAPLAGPLSLLMPVLRRPWRPTPCWAPVSDHTGPVLEGRRPVGGGLHSPAPFPQLPLPVLLQPHPRQAGAEVGAAPEWVVMSASSKSVTPLLLPPPALALGQQRFL